MDIEKLIQQANSGNASAQYQLAMAYEQGEKVGKDLGKAFTYIEQAAKNGYEQAYIKAALMHYEYQQYGGISKAMDYLHMACDSNNNQIKRFATDLMAQLIQTKDKVYEERTEDAAKLQSERNDNDVKKLLLANDFRNRKIIAIILPIVLVVGAIVIWRLLETLH